MHEYMGRGVFKSGSKQLTCKKLGMIAGGTGITPMLQIAASILDDPSDTTQVSLLYANQTEDDILVREMLDGCAATLPSYRPPPYSVREMLDGCAATLPSYRPPPYSVREMLDG